jgi:hypothetical protein
MNFKAKFKNRSTSRMRTGAHGFSVVRSHAECGSAVNFLVT